MDDVSAGEVQAVISSRRSAASRRFTVEARDKHRMGDSPVDEHGSGSVAAHADNVVVEDLQGEKRDVSQADSFASPASGGWYSPYHTECVVQTAR